MMSIETAAQILDQLPHTTGVLYFKLWLRARSKLQTGFRVTLAGMAGQDFGLGVSRNTVTKHFHALISLGLISFKKRGKAGRMQIGLPRLSNDHLEELFFALEHRIRPEGLGDRLIEALAAGKESRAWDEVAPFFTGMTLNADDLAPCAPSNQGILFPLDVKSVAPYRATELTSGRRPSRKTKDLLSEEHASVSASSEYDDPDGVDEGLSGQGQSRWGNRKIPSRSFARHPKSNRPSRFSAPPSEPTDNDPAPPSAAPQEAIQPKPYKGSGFTPENVYFWAEAKPIFDKIFGPDALTIHPTSGFIIPNPKDTTAYQVLTLLVKGVHRKDWTWDPKPQDAMRLLRAYEAFQTVHGLRAHGSAIPLLMFLAGRCRPEARDPLESYKIDKVIAGYAVSFLVATLKNKPFLAPTTVHWEKLWELKWSGPMAASYKRASDESLVPVDPIQFLESIRPYWGREGGLIELPTAEVVKLLKAESKSVQDIMRELNEKQFQNP